jgi:hypothetical protein
VTKTAPPDLRGQVDALLEAYPPTRPVWLDAEGVWREDPHDLHQRVSNELWHRLWLEGSGEAETGGRTPAAEPVTGLYAELWAPFERPTEGEAAPAAGAPAAAIRALAAAFGVRDPAGREALAVHESVCRLIEEEVLDRGSRTHIPEWDEAGKRRQAARRTRRDGLREKIDRALPPPAPNLRAALADALRGPGPTAEMVAVLVEEERVRDHLFATGSELGGEAEREVLSDVLPPRLGDLSPMPAALARTLIGLLSDPRFDTATGIPYQAAHTLGAVRDVRSCEALRRVLDTTGEVHTHLRAVLLYVLGCLVRAETRPEFAAVLAGPDSISRTRRDGSTYEQSLGAEQREAVWALGRFGRSALSALPALARCTPHPDRDVRLALAWALGRLGREQKAIDGGLDAAILIPLLQLLLDRDIKVFEEAAFALRELDLPEYLYTFYLGRVEKVPILALKPARTGLYELSETLLYLGEHKRPVVLAVTGDSGTGKTYFCQCLRDGFGGVGPEEILYLARDDPAHLAIFNRMLGLDFLRRHIDPEHYSEYPVSAEGDDPDRYFREFMAAQKDSRLIILDGWRDAAYFDHVIRLFYERGRLDLIVRFQATWSTRRLNLEARDKYLERVTACLSYVEDPVLEESRFCRGGQVISYHLDNSIPSRLTGPEIREVFGHAKVDAWGDHIRIGDFPGGRTAPLTEETVRFEPQRETPAAEGSSFTLAEAPLRTIETHFQRQLNEDPEREPNLLQTLLTPGPGIVRIDYYQPGQLAFGAADGSVGLLTGLGDRLFHTEAGEAGIDALAVLGERICVLDDRRRVRLYSLRRGTVAELPATPSPVTCLATDCSDRLVSGHQDGSISIWETASGRCTRLEGHSAAVRALEVCCGGTLWSGDDSGEFRFWDPAGERVHVRRFSSGRIRCLSVFREGHLVVGLEEPQAAPPGCSIALLDGAGRSARRLPVAASPRLNTLHLYFDGRIVAAVAAGPKTGGTLLVLDPRGGTARRTVLPGHAGGTTGCLTMGPRILTCGQDDDGGVTVKIWGADTYVRSELEKLPLLPDPSHIPPWYRTLI